MSLYIYVLTHTHIECYLRLSYFPVVKILSILLSGQKRIKRSNVDRKLLYPNRTLYVNNDRENKRTICKNSIRCPVQTSQMEHNDVNDINTISEHIHPWIQLSTEIQEATEATQLEFWPTEMYKSSE